jgi:hypothetical protein
LFIVFPEPGVIKTIRSLQIFNRWGGQVFQSTNGSIDATSTWWDGKHQGKDAETGVYIYQVILELPNGELEVLKGEVKLVR